jgi:hypothetical protein
MEEEKAVRLSPVELYVLCQFRPFYYFSINLHEEWRVAVGNDSIRTPPESRDFFPVRLAYLSGIGSTCEPVPLGLPAHFEVRAGIFLRPHLRLDQMREPCMAVFTVGVP